MVHNQYSFAILLFLTVNNVESIDSISGHLPKYMNYDEAPKCEKCIACLGVALQLNDTFMDAYSSDTKIVELPRLRKICKENFKKYSIKEFEGRHFFGESKQTAANSNYLAVLMKEKCDKISQSIKNLYNEWLNNKQDLAPILCVDRNEFGPCAQDIDLKDFSGTTSKRSWWKRILEMLRIIDKPKYEDSSSRLVSIWDTLKKSNFCCPDKNC